MAPRFDAISCLGADAFVAFLNACNRGLDGRLSAFERHTVLRLVANEWVRADHNFATEAEEDDREDDVDFDAVLDSLVDQDLYVDPCPCDGDCKPADTSFADLGAPNTLADDLKDAIEGIGAAIGDAINAILPTSDDRLAHDKDGTYSSAGTVGGSVECEEGDIIRVNWTDMNGGPAVARVVEVLRNGPLGALCLRVEQGAHHKLGTGGADGYLVYPNMVFDGKLWGEYLTYDFDAPTSELDRLYGDMEPQAFLT